MLNDPGRELEAISALVEAYGAGLKTEYSGGDYNETEVRIDFVNKLFTLLGWDVDNDRHLPRWRREVIHEDRVYVEEEDGGTARKRPDYTFQLNGEKCFYLETKKPAVDILTSKDAAFQVRRYGWNGNMRISVLCNFTHLSIYDCRVPPKEGDDPSVARIALFRYDEYPARWDELNGMLSRNAVQTGEFEERFDTVDKATDTIPFNHRFLRQMRDWRSQLCADIHGKNPAFDEETVNILSQRILNRIIFLRICEDRDQERYGQLKRITDYGELRGLFIESDRKYDSGLFDLIEEGGAPLSDETIVEIFKDLYYPNSIYDFSVMDSFVLSEIYEQFLTESIAFTGDGIEVRQKNEVRENKGIVTTPRYIADRIVEDTLAPIAEGKDENGLLGLHVADISCGSGVFLLSAYEYLTGRMLDIVGTDDPMRTFTLRREILRRCIYGVDVDPLAVEIAKFSLMVQLLEHVGRDIADAFLSGTRKRLLPNIDSHVVTGNSLVDNGYYLMRPGTRDADTLKRVRAFDWDGDFPAEGFDAIVGNPPYVRVQRLVNYAPEEYEYAKAEGSPYTTGKASTIDKYFLFVERAMGKIRSGGTLGYIVPNKFMTNQSGRILRRLLSRTGRIKRIIHFGDQQVFAGRLTYTCILEISGHREDSFDIAFIDDLAAFKYTGEAAYDTYGQDYLGEDPWVFPPDWLNRIISRNMARTNPLGTLADIHVGMQTSADSIYMIKDFRETGDLIEFKDPVDGSPTRIERSITRGAIYDARLSKYHRIVPNARMLFPYPADMSRRVGTYDRETMRRRYPLALAYLSKHRERLDRRNMPGRNEDNWYGYGRSQSILWFQGGDKLVWPVLSRTGNYVYDPDVAFTGGGNGPYFGLSMKEGTGESIFYVQAILNHWLMDRIVATTASEFHGGYPSHGKQFVSRLPIRRIDFDDPRERETHDAIVAHVRRLMELAAQADGERLAVQRRPVEDMMAALEREMNGMIDGLYGITSEERRKANE